MLHLLSGEGIYEISLAKKFHLEKFWCDLDLCILLELHLWKNFSFVCENLLVKGLDSLKARNVKKLHYPQTPCEDESKDYIRFFYFWVSVSSHGSIRLFTSKILISCLATYPSSEWKVPDTDEDSFHNQRTTYTNYTKIKTSPVDQETWSGGRLFRSVTLSSKI